MWKEKVASKNDRALSTPTNYAHRTWINDVAKVYDPITGMYDLNKCSTQFTVGDSLRVIPAVGDKLSEDGFDVTVTEREGFKYKLEGMPTSGRYFVVKQFKQDLTPNEVGDNRYAIVPITLNMLQANGEELRKKGITSPGWYMWRQIVDSKNPTEILDMESILLVSIKGFTNEDTAYESQFDIEGIMKFDENGEMILG